MEWEAYNAVSGCDPLVAVSGCDPLVAVGIEGVLCFSDWCEINDSLKAVYFWVDEVDGGVLYDL